MILESHNFHNILSCSEWFLDPMVHHAKATMGSSTIVNGVSDQIGQIYTVFRKKHPLTFSFISP